jgi:hypothetical protein
MTYQLRINTTNMAMMICSQIRATLRIDNGIISVLLYCTYSVHGESSVSCCIVHTHYMGNHQWAVVLYIRSTWGIISELFYCSYSVHGVKLARQTETRTIGPSVSEAEDVNKADEKVQNDSHWLDSGRDHRSRRWNISFLICVITNSFWDEEYCHIYRYTYL